MRGGGDKGPGWRRLDRLTAGALLLAVAAALATAVRLGAAAGGDGQELLARVRERTERRLATEREQLRAVLAEEGAAGLAAASARFPENSQVLLALAASHRERGETEVALREYRRAVELVRDYADRRSPHSLAASLAPWLRQIRPLLSGPALGDLYFLERALAGGCA